MIHLYNRVFQVKGCAYQGCIGCNIEGVWGVNIPYLLCDKVIHLGYNGDKFFR